MSQFLSSNELFINIKNPPQWNPRKSYYEQDIDVLDFYLEEKRKITEGITIGGYYIHPWLYWHMNFFKTPIPTPDNKGNLFEVMKNPPLDDNFLWIVENYYEAEKQSLGMFLYGCRGSTKALKNDEPLLYKEGWKPVGEAKVGDRIYGADGKLTTIVGVYPQGVVDLYKITLRDGREIVTCDEHLWHVYDFQARRVRTLPLKEIIPYYKYNRKYTGNKYKNGQTRIAEVYNYYVPMNECMKFTTKDLPLDPYFLGIWLGDGTSAGTAVTNIDKEIVDYVYDFAKKYKLDVRISGGITYTLTSGSNKGKSRSGNNKVLAILQKLNLINNKHIPDIYLKSSKEQRLELLRGLLDSDGTIGIDGQMSFSQSNLPMIKQVRELVLSLGINCTLSELDINYILKNGEKARSWKLILYTEEKVFKLTRKKDRIIKTHKLNKFKRNYNAIVNIEKIEPDYATCIRVDNQDKLFVTRDYIVTHNTTAESSLITWLNTIKPNGTTSVIGGDEGDLKNISSLIAKGFNNVHPAFFIPQLISNWDTKVEIGIKEKDGFRLPYSQVSITNANKGTEKSSEKGAGLSPVGFIIDEASKFYFKKILQSALPSFVTPYGAKLVHVLSATSGNKVLSKDAEDVITNPEAYRLLPMDWQRLERFLSEEHVTWQRSRSEPFSVFFPGQMSYRLAVPKVEKNLADHLDIVSADLSQILIKTTNWEEATKLIVKTNDSFKKIEDQEKNRMYFPLELADVFLTESANPFPTAIIDRHIRKLQDEGRTGKDIDIFKTAEGKNKAEFVTKKRAAVSHGGGEADAPIILFGELPEIPPARHIFVSGLDDYKLDLSDTDSLGAFYVIKRRNLEPNQPCETIAASYVARPYNHRDLHATCEKMIEVWDAECNMESADISFVQHLDLKGKAMKLLTPAFSFATAISNTNSKLNSRYGVYPTTANKAYMFNLLIDFCKEEHVMDIDDEGNQIIKYGVEFIDDIDLLKEMMSFKKGGNFDRITAFMHALALARELDKKGIAPIDRRHDQLRKEQMRNKPKTQRTVFSKNSNRKVF